MNAYDQGLLVPFLGAGMSRSACPDWQGLIRGLEERTGIDPDHEGHTTADLMRRGAAVVRRLKRRGDDVFTSALRDVLYSSGEPAPPQTASLARIWWPLVLTTNYDDHFARAYRNEHRGARSGLTVLGRWPHECQRVLSALSSGTESILWALQGHVGQACSPDAPAPLEAELVVGHEEYRRVTHTAPHFRRAFAEVFRRRSLLFLGSSLADPYLLELFGEILELSGANPAPHFAMVRRGEVDPLFLRSRFNIIVMEYDDHGAVPRWLDVLRERLASARPRPTRWAFALGAAADGAGGGADPGLEIVRGPLVPPAAGEVAAVSVGTAAGGRLWVSSGIHGYVRSFWPDEHAVERGYRIPPLTDRFVFGYTAEDGRPVPVVAVNARVDEHDQRDLRLIGEAMRELLDWAAAEGYRRVRISVLASGRTAHYPARYSLSEMLRAFGRWRRAGNPAVALSVHLLDPGAIFEVATGRLDVTELLTCDDVRFWVEVVDDGRLLERELVFLSAEQRLEYLCHRFDIPREDWRVEVTPRPRADSCPDRVIDRWDADLLALGVLPGSTLRLISPRAAEAGRAHTGPGS